MRFVIPILIIYCLLGFIVLYVLNPTVLGFGPHVDPSVGFVKLWLLRLNAVLLWPIVAIFARSGIVPPS